MVQSSRRASTHVEVADQQDWLVFAGAVQADDQILFAVVGAADVEVAVGESGVAEALRHGLGGGGDVADRICGVDFDELLEDVVRELPGLVVDLSGGG